MLFLRWARFYIKWWGCFYIFDGVRISPENKTIFIQARLFWTALSKMRFSYQMPAVEKVIFDSGLNTPHFLCVYRSRRGVYHNRIKLNGFLYLLNALEQKHFGQLFLLILLMTLFD